jgi:acetyl esterase
MTAQKARTLIDARRLPVDNLDDVASAEDRVPQEDGGPVRVYQPHGKGGTRPAVVFCHGGGYVLRDLDSHDCFCGGRARHTESVAVPVDC